MYIKLHLKHSGIQPIPNIRKNVRITSVPPNCALYNKQCTAYIILCTVSTEQCTLSSVHCRVNCAVHSVHYTVYSVDCRVYSVQCTVYSVQCTVVQSLSEFTSAVLFKKLPPSKTSIPPHFTLKCIAHCTALLIAVL